MLRLILVCNGRTHPRQPPPTLSLTSRVPCLRMRLTGAKIQLNLAFARRDINARLEFDLSDRCSWAAPGRFNQLNRLRILTRKIAKTDDESVC
jgi:hypothetical protein